MTQLLPGKPQSLRPEISRIVAPNGGPMTGPGTNSYLLGSKHLALLDPGPDLPEHIDALTRAIEAGGGELADILVTHTHLDHSPAAATLAGRFGARLIGLAAPSAPRQDRTFVPDYQPADGEWLQSGGFSIQAVHTPGHASNHVCYWLQSESLLFTGDHVMQGSTVVIPPPDGDMAAYMQSLQKVRDLQAAHIAPGHGVLIDDCDRYLQRLLRHRRQREARVLDRLGKLGQASIDLLLPQAYADVPQALWPVAKFSLHAHLLKLAAEDRVRQQGECWEVV